MRALGLVWLVAASGCARDGPVATGSRDAAAFTAAVDAPAGGGPSHAGVGDASSADAGGAGGTVGTFLDGAADGPVDADRVRPEERLSDTGLYAQGPPGRLAPDVRPYEPAFELWSDGAIKRRWVFLPPGASIDTSDMDAWRFPVGTKFWKEFTCDGVRVETRLLEKTGAADDAWRMLAFQWLDDMSDAVARPDGVLDASGTPHDIPGAPTCSLCHRNVPGRVLGFGALQLSHDRSGVTLEALSDEGRLSASPSGAFTLPGTPVERAALGYLHGNCGGCHNPHSTIQPLGVDMELWLTVDRLGVVEDTPTYATTLGELTAGGLVRVTPGDPRASEVYRRMSVRGGWPQMPPIGSERVDPDGLAAVDAWIRSLRPGVDAGVDARGDGGVVDAGRD